MKKLTLYLFCASLFVFIITSCVDAQKTVAELSTAATQEEAYHLKTHPELVEDSQGETYDYEADAVAIADYDIGEYEPAPLTFEQEQLAWERFERNYKYTTHQPLVSVQQEVHPLVRHAAWISGRLGISVAPEDFVVTIGYFDWLNFITMEQLDIVREYLGIAEGEFDDQLIVIYLMQNMRQKIPYYDAIPFEEVTNNPRRIMVRMLEGYIIETANLVIGQFYQRDGNLDAFYADHAWLTVSEFGRPFGTFRQN